MPSVLLWGWDRAAEDWVKVLVNPLGYLQTVVVASALPAGGATLAAQDVSNDWLSRINVKLRGGLPATLDAGHLRVREQNWPATYPLSAAQIALLQAVTVGNFPADYPLPAAQVATLQQVTEQGTPSVHLYGYDTANWQELLVESDVLKNLRVKLYDGANGINSHNLITAAFTYNNRGLIVASAPYLFDVPTLFYRAWSTARSKVDADSGAYTPDIALRGFNGASYDRLRSYGVGILKVGRAEIDSTTVRKTAAGAVVAGAHNLYWVACSPDSPSAEWELTDAIAGGGAVVYDHFDSDKHSEHLIFDPPMKFATGIWIEKFDHMHSLVFCYV